MGTIFPKEAPPPSARHADSQPSWSVIPPVTLIPPPKHGGGADRGATEFAAAGSLREHRPGCAAQDVHQPLGLSDEAL